MPRTMLTDQHWQKLKVILYRIRTGCPWRDIPSYFGQSNSIFRRFNRWSSTVSDLDYSTY